MLLAASLPALAKGKKNPPPSITAVIVDTVAGEVQILGSDFTDPDVTLGPVVLPLPYLLSAPGELIIEIPAMVPGDYKLILAQGKNEIEWDLTIGAAGLQGPEGLPGTDGAVGPEGPQGPQGDQGPVGNDGAQGPQGDQGPVGNDGADGADGAFPAVPWAYGFFSEGISGYPNGRNKGNIFNPTIPVSFWTDTKFANGASIYTGPVSNSNSFSNRITTIVEGTYKVSVHVAMSGDLISEDFQLWVRKNGTGPFAFPTQLGSFAINALVQMRSHQQNEINQPRQLSVETIVFMNGTTDYVEVVVGGDGGSIGRVIYDATVTFVKIW